MPEPPSNSRRTTAASLPFTARCGNQSGRNNIAAYGRCRVRADARANPCELIPMPREDRATGPEIHRRADGQRGAAGDPDHDRPAVGVALGLDVDDGIVTVVAEGCHPARHSVRTGLELDLLRPDQNGHLAF